jgi:hypothetical protein
VTKDGGKVLQIFTAKFIIGKGQSVVSKMVLLEEDSF